tara:strand:- start:695 stop:853 length:159 start_codon:yes stop_codon:yes gene_type:complete
LLENLNYYRSLRYTNTQQQAYYNSQAVSLKADKRSIKIGSKQQHYRSKLKKK